MRWSKCAARSIGCRIRFSTSSSRRTVGTPAPSAASRRASCARWFRRWGPDTMAARLGTITQDVASLNEFITHLTDKIQFVLDATLGLINIAQSDLMKVLTIVSVIGIPPTLIAGIYGMNFVRMPELHWAFGYAYGLTLIVVTGVAPLFWFRKKGWL
ncbi:MAG: hypothetical protein B7Z58_10630 [Acidiphilium sp. 37-64-53]|nr:MAG: hypothetical protein B7Z58_10630 [Acidiphilium sp. 37-64-53]